MKSEFIAVWGEMWREVWHELASHEAAPDDLFCELYRELAVALRTKKTVEEVANIIDDAKQSTEAFQNTSSADLAGERALVVFLEEAYGVVEDLGADALGNCYFILLTAFIEKYSLRYDLRRPCQLCPTLPGVFASLVRELRTVAAADAHLDALMKEFESAIRDLRTDSSEGKIKTCIQKQVNLLEAVGGKCRGVTEGELGKICGQLNNWPHLAVRAALKNLYGFTSDYPGIRHGGNAAGAIRQIEMRDMVAMSILLTGFSPFRGLPGEVASRHSIPNLGHAAVMRVQRQFAEEVKHRQAERAHTLSLSHGQNYILRELRVLFAATTDEDQKAKINVLEKAFRGPITRAVNREVVLLRRNGVSGEPLLTALTRIYDQHNLRDWVDRRSLHAAARPVPKIVCSEALV